MPVHPRPPPPPPKDKAKTWIQQDKTYVWKSAKKKDYWWHHNIGLETGTQLTIP